MDKWKMWNQWKNWKKILKWTSPFIIIAMLVAIFWPDSKAVSTLPESFKLTTETELTSLGSNGTSIKLRIGDNNTGYVYCAEAGRASVGTNAQLTNPSIITDQTVINILNNGFLGKAFDGWSDNDSYAATQLAIWWYYHEDVLPSTPLTSTLVQEVEARNYSSEYEHIVTKAKELMNSSVSTGININNVNNILKINGDYIESDFIKVLLSGASEYTVILNNTDFSIVDTNGNEKTSFTAGEQFKIRIKKENITSDTSVNLTIKATATSYTPYLYTPDPLIVCNDGTQTNTSCGSVGESRRRQSVIALAEDEKTLEETLVLNYTLSTSEITITKIDKDTKQPLDGAKVRLVDEIGNTIEEWTTEKTSKTIKLTPGTYTLTEVSAPEGYIKSEQVYTINIDEAGNANQSNIVIENIRFKELVVNKVNEVNEHLKGAKLRLVSNDGTFEKEWITTNYSEKIKLGPGVYTLTEISAPEGYVKSTQIETITVSSSGIISPSVITITNVKITTGVTIIKRDLETKEMLAGAILRLVSSDGMFDETWTTTTTSKVFELTPGTYTLTEVEAPKGYVKSNESQMITVSNDGVASPNTITLDNQKIKTPVTISKIDSETKGMLSGAKLRLVSSDGTFDETWTTNTTSKVFELTPGTYTLTEVEAPKGYIKSNESKTIVINQDGTTLESNIVIPNDPMEEVSISKQDVTTGKELPGAELTLYDANNNLVDKWISTNKPHKLKLLPGDYTLKETIAPEWYVKSEETVTFTVKEDGTTNLDKIVMYNKPMEEVSIIKKDASSGNILIGAKLKLTNENDVLIDEWVSTDEPHKLKLKPGIYILTETEAPEGYTKSDEIIKFTVYNDGTTDLGDVIMYNRYIEVPKTDLNSQMILGLVCGIFGVLGIALICFSKKKITNI